MSVLDRVQMVSTCQDLAQTVAGHEAQGTAGEGAACVVVPSLSGCVLIAPALPRVTTQAGPPKPSTWRHSDPLSHTHTHTHAKGCTTTTTHHPSTLSSNCATETDTPDYTEHPGTRPPLNLLFTAAEIAGARGGNSSDINLTEGWTTGVLLPEGGGTFPSPPRSH
jgi:hypothetical protein